MKKIIWMVIITVILTVVLAGCNIEALSYVDDKMCGEEWKIGSGTIDPSGAVKIYDASSDETTDRYFYFTINPIATGTVELDIDTDKPVVVHFKNGTEDIIIATDSYTISEIGLTTVKGTMDFRRRQNDQIVERVRGAFELTKTGTWE